MKPQLPFKLQANINSINSISAASKLHEIATNCILSHGVINISSLVFSFQIVLNVNDGQNEINTDIKILRVTHCINKRIPQNVVKKISAFLTERGNGTQIQDGEARNHM